MIMIKQHAILMIMLYYYTFAYDFALFRRLAENVSIKWTYSIRAPF
jgi:hypothetical protein